MGCNVGHIDRMIRFILGVVSLAIAGLTALPVWGTAIALVVGTIALLTGVMGFCPAWKVFGINTCAPKQSGHA